SSAPGPLFAAAVPDDFFFGAFFFAALAAGALVVAAVDCAALVSAGAAPGVSIAAADGGFVVCWASKRVETKVVKRSFQQFLFITLSSRDLIPVSVNVRHFPGRSSPSLILPI